jgi:hypothetical protein
MRQSDSNFQMEALKALFDLSNSEWLIIAPLLPGAEGKKNGRFNRWAMKGIPQLPGRHPACRLSPVDSRIESTT